MGTNNIIRKSYVIVFKKDLLIFDNHEVGYNRLQAVVSALDSGGPTAQAQSFKSRRPCHTGAGSRNLSKIRFSPLWPTIGFQHTRPVVPLAVTITPCRYRCTYRRI